MENLPPTAATPQLLTASEASDLGLLKQIKSSASPPFSVCRVSPSLQTQGRILESTQLLHPGGSEAFLRNLLCRWILSGEQA